MELDDVIEFKSEHTGLDFKAIQYRKENFNELLKDIIAMANANVEGERLIIVGVKKHPGGNFSINPIPEAEFVDAAIYQQLVIDNIEPDIAIDYVPYLYKGNALIGVLKILPSADKPYMMKKAYGTDKAIRRPGECFVRKGTSTFPLMRKDIDRIFEEKKRIDAYVHQISCYFSGTQKSKVYSLKPNAMGKLRSHRQAEKIKKIIEKKEAEEKVHLEKMAQDKFYAAIFSHKLDNIEFPFQATPYEKRSLETLRKNLENVGKTYLVDDCYELFEKKSEKINITIFNEGSKYLEDTVIEIQIPSMKGLFIADKIYRKPVDESPFNTVNYPHVDSENLYYPHYEQHNEVYIFNEKLGDLRHLQPKDVFSVPLRVTIMPELAGSEIEIKLTIFGKTLPMPITDTLLLKIDQ